VPHIVASAHFLEDRGVALGDRSELRAAIFSRSGDIRDRDVVDHPPFIPAARGGRVANAPENAFNINASG
jgi:hypothetical protein